MQQSASQNPWIRNNSSILEIYDMETRTREILAEFDEVIEAPNWSKDGRSLFFNRGGRMYRFELSTKAVHEIPSDFANRCNNDHVLSPDGTRMAISHAAEDGKSRIYIMPIEGGVPECVTPNGPSYLHGWSPDGGSLAYCAERNGLYDVYVTSVHGGDSEVRLTVTPGLDDGPEYDPTGRHIWFNSTRSGLMQVWRMNHDGGDQRQMTFDEEWNSWFPHVSPDGRHVVMIAYRKGDLRPDEHLPNKQVELRLMPAEGGAVETLTALYGGQGTINVNSWSPDSRQFAFVSYRERD